MSRIMQELVAEGRAARGFVTHSTTADPSPDVVEQSVTAPVPAPAPVPMPPIPTQAPPKGPTPQPTPWQADCFGLVPFRWRVSIRYDGRELFHAEAMISGTNYDWYTIAPDFSSININHGQWIDECLYLSRSLFARVVQGRRPSISSMIDPL